MVPAGLKSLGLAVSSIKSGLEETTGKGEWEQAEKPLSSLRLEILWMGW